MIVGSHIVRIALSAACLSFAISAAGQNSGGDYPSRTIRLVIPFSPGGPTDLFARMFAERMAAVSGQQMVVENRTGAAGNIAYGTVASAAPDGYTLLLGTPGLATNPSLYKSLPFAPEKDFRPVALLAMAPLVLLAPSQPPSVTVASLVAQLKESAGRNSYPSGGVGTTTHLAAEMFKLKTVVDAVHVPYRGSGPAFVDMLAGRHAFMFETIGASKPYVSTGKLRILAIAGEKRTATLPDVPTVAEAGIEGVLASTWNMLLAPASTPKSTVEALHRLSQKALSDAAFVQRTAELAIDLIPDSTPDKAAAFLASETQRWAEVISSSGIKAAE